MKKQILFSLILGLAATPLYAGPHHYKGFHDKAKVVEVDPIYEIVEVPVERESCWTEDVETTEHSSAGTVVGGILGGVIGHQVGHGDRRKIATVAGTVIGAAIGHESDIRNGHTTYETHERCAVRREYAEEERINGYRVTYRYRGQHYTTVMDHEPGRFIPVRVDVTPVE